MKNLKIIPFIFLVGLTGIAYSQSTLDHFAPEYFEGLHFAHRGGYTYGPENTLNTILNTIENGANAIEVDVQLTKDSTLVLFHDDTIEKILQTDSKTHISEITFGALAKTPLRDTTQGMQYVCSLDQLVHALTVLISDRNDKEFLLELDFKPHGKHLTVAINKLVSILDKESKTYGDVLYNYFFVSTFYPGVLKAIHEKDSKIKTAFALHNNPNKSKLKAKAAIQLAPYFIKKYDADIIEPNLCMVTSRFVKKWHKKNILINTYTANSSCEKNYIEQFNIAYTTNCPTGFCETDNSGQTGKPKKWCKGCQKYN